MSRHTHFIGVLAATFALTLFQAPHSHADPLVKFVERPLLRFILMHTEDGAMLSTRILGNRIMNDAALRRFAKKLSDPKWAADRSAIIERLELAEAELRTRMLEARAPGEILPEVGEQAARLLGIRGAGENGRIEFTSELPPASFQSNRARLLGEPGNVPEISPGADLSGKDLAGVNLSGQDLRFTRWKRTRAGNLSQADLRGADLRGLELRPESELDGAFYDQFTSLPFTRHEAAARGMKYRPSNLPESRGLVAIKRAEKRIEKSPNKESPLDTEKAAQRIFAELGTLAPRQIEGVELFSQPRHFRKRGGSETSFEVGRVTQASDDELMTDLIAELAKSGGELRRVVSVNLSTGKVLKHSGAYFSLDGHIPTIAVSARASSPTLVHEREHLRDWVKLYQIQLSGGLSPKKALQAALIVRRTPQYKAMTERHAVRAELREQARLDNLAGKALAERVGRHESPGFAHKASYPDLEALGVLFEKRALIEVTSSPALLAQAEGHARRIIHNALSARRTRFLKLGQQSASDFTAEELFHEVVASNAGRFAKNGSLRDIRAFFDELLPSEIARLRDDAFRQAIEPRFPAIYVVTPGAP